MSHILYVEDDAEMREIVGSVLEDVGYEVSLAANISDARKACGAHIDLAILDIRLGSENGLELAKEIQTQYTFPIIMLTGLGDVIDKVIGLEVGAIDYITKPFHNRELTARVKAGLRRVAADSTLSEPAMSTGIYHFGNWQLNLGARKLTLLPDQEVEISAHQFYVLTELVQNPGRVLSRERLMDSIPYKKDTPVDRSIDIHIGNIRKILGDKLDEPHYIKTVRSVGYVFVATVSGTRSAV